MKIKDIFTSNSFYVEFALDNKFLILADYDIDIENCLISYNKEIVQDLEFSHFCRETAIEYGYSHCAVFNILGAWEDLGNDFYELEE